MRGSYGRVAVGRGSGRAARAMGDGGEPVTAGRRDAVIDPIGRRTAERGRCGRCRARTGRGREGLAEVFELVVIEALRVARGGVRGCRLLSQVADVVIRVGGGREIGGGGAGQAGIGSGEQSAVGLVVTVTAVDVLGLVGVVLGDLSDRGIGDEVVAADGSELPEAVVAVADPLEGAAEGIDTVVDVGLYCAS